jgi:hypothetical protein
MDNRCGRKADGTDQNIEDRNTNAEDAANFGSIAKAAVAQEKEIEKMLKRTLKRFPIYTNWLTHVKGVGEIASGWIVGEFDIEKADTVSKLWQYAGLNPDMVRGKKIVKAKAYKPETGEIIKEMELKTKEGKKEKGYMILTHEMIRGDKLSEGFVSPFNRRLKTALVGVLATNFYKAKAPYAIEFYYPYKKRLENEKNGVNGNGNPWSEESKGHRDNAAKRYMIKMFLKDLYAAWREIEGLPVRAPYSEEYLGKKHGKK